MKKSLALGAFLFTHAVFGQQNQAQSAEDQATADRLLSCASAHAHNIKILQAMGRRVDALYKSLGYFRLAGQAFSSKEYSEQKYNSLRESLIAGMDQALANRSTDQGVGVQAFDNALNTELNECAKFQREKSAFIKDRLEKITITTLQESAPNTTQAIPKKQQSVTEPILAQKEQISIEELLGFPNVSCDAKSNKRGKVRASHVVVEFLHHPPSEEQIRFAYEKILRAQAELENGESFGQVEAKYSAGALSRGTNDGDLGYVGRGKMVPEFERMAFCLPINKLSPVFASPFGFHILQVTGVLNKFGAE
jgi:parvulin-like peptidyl-prolyl isomerase